MSEHPTVTPEHTAGSREGFDTAECAWLDEMRKGWAPLTEPQAAVIRQALCPRGELREELPSLTGPQAAVIRQALRARSDSKTARPAARRGAA